MRTPPRGIFAAAFFAVLLHVALFVLIRPATSNGLSGTPVAPNTSYLARGDGRSVPMGGVDVRVMASPVLFSLPSSMGFSRELLTQDVRTPLIFSQPVESEQFLEVGLVRKNAELDARQLMLTTQVPRSPELPEDVFQTSEKRLAARRVTLAPELKERMVGGVVLPPELNQEVSKAWGVRAQISVSEQGKVRHVFLDEPLESAPMNMRILQLLHSLKFNAGEPVDGMVEIYSPESTPAVEVKP